MIFPATRPDAFIETVFFKIAAAFLADDIGKVMQRPEVAPWVRKIRVAKFVIGFPESVRRRFREIAKPALAFLQPSGRRVPLGCAVRERIREIVNPALYG